VRRVNGQKLIPDDNNLWNTLGISEHYMTLKLNPAKAQAELQLWQQQGKNLLALQQVKRNKTGFSLHIPGYRCDNRYQLGTCYPSQQAALAAYGELLDAVTVG